MSEFGLNEFQEGQLHLTGYVQISTAVHALDATGINPQGSRAIRQACQQQCEAKTYSASQDGASVRILGGWGLALAADIAVSTELVFRNPGCSPEERLAAYDLLCALEQVDESL